MTVRIGAATIGPRRRLAWRKAPATMVLPALLPILAFIFAPLVYTFVLSFMKWNLVSPEKSFVGLRNYSDLGSTPEFAQSLLTTAIYAGLFVVAVVPGGLLLARLVNRKLPAMRFLRSLIFMPYVIPFVGGAIAWEWMFNADNGVIEQILRLMGFGGPDWFGGHWTAVFAVEIVFIWQNIGFYMLIFLSGIQALDPSLSEAASVEGASARRIFWNIELPQLRPVMLFALVYSLIHAFQLFDQIFVLTEGGPGTSTMSLVYFIYSQGFQIFSIGKAAAGSVVLIGILCVVSWGAFRLVRD